MTDRPIEDCYAAIAEDVSAAVRFGPDRIRQLIERHLPEQARLVAELAESQEQARRLVPYKIQFCEALDCVDRAFQVDSTKPPPILPDFCQLGANKFEAVPKLAQAFKDSQAEAKRYRDALLLIDSTLHGQLPITKQVKDICREALNQ